MKYTDLDDEFYERMVRQVLVDMRGRSTQKRMSERLGYKFNQWHKWESGQKVLMWSNLERIAVELKIDLPAAMRVMTNSHDTNVANQSGGTFLKRAIETYAGLDRAEAAKKLGISKATLYRILRPENDASVALIFRCLAQLSSVLPFLLSILIRDSKSAYLRGVIKDTQRRASLEADFPWLSAVEAFLETNEYRSLKVHSDRAVAKQLGLSVDAVKHGLKLLLENEAILKKSEKFVLNAKRVDLETSISDSARFAAFWTRVCVRRFQTFDHVPTPRRGWSARVVPVSEHAHEKVRELMWRFHVDMMKVFQEDGGREKVKVLAVMLHAFDHHEFKSLNLTGDRLQK